MDPLVFLCVPFDVLSGMHRDNKNSVGTLISQTALSSQCIMLFNSSVHK